MAELVFYDSSLSATQIESVLTGCYGTNGLLKSDGHGNITVGESGGSSGAGAKSGAGAPTTSTTGVVNQLYYDTTNRVLYICKSIVGTTYTWEAIAYVPTSTAVNGFSLTTNRTLWAKDIPYKEIATPTALSDYELGAVIIAFGNALGMNTTVTGYSDEQLSSYWLNEFLNAGYTKADLANIVITEKRT